MGKTMYERINGGEFENRAPWGKDKEVRLRYRENELRCIDAFKEAVFEDLGITDNPKREKLFSIAWDLGHSSGYGEVFNYMVDMVDLINPGTDQQQA